MTEPTRRPAVLHACFAAACAGGLMPGAACFVAPNLAYDDTADEPATDGAATDAGSSGSEDDGARGEPTTTNQADGTGTTGYDSGDTTPDSSDGETDAPTDGRPTISIGPLRIAADRDDGMVWGGSDPDFEPSGQPGGQPNGAWFGEEPVGLRLMGYFRFELPATIPAGSMIDAASFSLHTHALSGAWDESETALSIWVEDSPDAPQVSSGSAYPFSQAGVTLLPETIRWPARGGLAWPPAERQHAPDLGASLQSLVDTHGGLDAGAHIQLWIGIAEPTGTAEAFAGFTDYWWNADEVAELEIVVRL